MGRKKYHKDSWAWNRIQEILNDYWADEPDEFKVEVEMRFRKVNGETQYKHIHWVNPKYADHSGKGSGLKLVPISEMSKWLACPHCGERLTDMPWLIAHEPDGYDGDKYDTMLEHRRERYETAHPMFEDFEKQYVENYRCLDNDGY